MENHLYIIVEGRKLKYFSMYFRLPCFSVNFNYKDAINRNSFFSPQVDHYFKTTFLPGFIHCCFSANDQILTVVGLAQENVFVTVV